MSNVGTAVGGATHYRWDDLPEDSPVELLARRRMTGEHAMIARVALRKGCDVKTHSHDNEQISILLTGRMRFGIGEEGSPDRKEVVVGAGEVLHLPKRVPHSALALEDSVVLDVFSPPSMQTGIDRQPKR